MNQEYQIPNNNNQSNFDANQTGGTFRSFASETNNTQERASSVAKRVYEIGNSIASARNRYIEQNFSFNNSGEKNIIKGAFKKIFNNNVAVFKNEAELKQEESKLGSSLFASSLAPGEVIHFFNDNEKSWFFYKETGVGTKESKSFTIHYEVNDNGILRVSDLTGAKGEFISGKELENFTKSTELYQQLVFSRIYGGNGTGNSVQ